MENVIVIGIAGGTGSGKSTLIKRISEEFADRITMLSHDFYYKAHDEMSYEERCKLNYDHPDAFENDLMIRHLKQLKAGKSVRCPVYDYTVHNRSKDTVLIKPAKVIIVEGILILADKQLCDEMDIRVFVDTDADVRILRRIIRDVKKRERTLESVIDQYLTTVKPMHEAFVEPSKKNADVIIPVGGYNQVALDMVIERVRAHLALYS